MSLISAGSISLDSTFKLLVTLKATLIYNSISLHNLPRFHMKFGIKPLFVRFDSSMSRPESGSGPGIQMEPPPPPPPVFLPETRSSVPF